MIYFCSQAINYMSKDLRYAINEYTENDGVQSAMDKLQDEVLTRCCVVSLPKNPMYHYQYEDCLMTTKSK